jgi:hypothetical protein
MIPLAVLCVDRVKPTGAFTSPAPGTVSGVVTLTVNAADNDQVASVQFYIGGTAIGGPDTVAPYSVAYDTRSVLNGNYTFQAVVTDRVGNTVVPQVNVTIANAPVVTITSPGQSSQFGGGFAFTANVTSYDAGCNSSFQIDGSQYDGLQGQGQGTVSLGWGSIDSMGLSNAGHTFAVYATDSHGNTGSAAVTATVRNVPTNPPSFAGPTGLLADYVDDMNNFDSWDNGGAYGSGWCAPFDYAVWVAKGFTLQCRMYMNYYAEGKSAIGCVKFNNGAWTGPQWYPGDSFTGYGGWINVGGPAYGQLQARMQVTREPGGDYHIGYNYTQVDFQWVG